MDSKLIILVLLAAFFLWIIYHQKKLDVTFYKITSAKLEHKIGSLTFVVLSDLHNNIMYEDNHILFDYLDKIKPKFIVIAGDMLVGKRNNDFTPSLHFLEKISRKYICYYGLGNHEYRLKTYPEIYGDMYNRYMKQIKSFGIYVLDNEHINVNCDGTNITIYGLSIGMQYYKRIDKEKLHKEDINKLLGECNPLNLNIMIAHNPQFFKEYVKWGADVILSGHVHGGVVRLPFLGGLVSPQYTFFPKYDAGLYQDNKTSMVISRGLGMHTIPFRLFNNYELVVTKLVKKQK